MKLYRSYWQSVSTLSLVLFFGVLISADSDDENSNFSSGINEFIRRSLGHQKW